VIILSATTDKLQAVTSSAATVDVHVSWADLSSGSVTPGRTNTAISSATTTDILAAPGASTQRNAKNINIRNRDASTSCDVTVRFNQNGTTFDLHKATLTAGSTLEYVEGVGWFVVEVPLSSVSRRMVLGSDQSNSTTTPTEVTGISLTTGIGTFKFQYLVRYQAAATTTGVRYSVNHTGTVAFFLANLLWVDASATAATAAPDQDAVLSTGSVYGSFAARAKSTAGWGTTLSVDSANADMLIIIDGLMQVTADGDIELWHGSEVAAASTTKSGTSLVIEKTG